MQRGRDRSRMEGQAPEYPVELPNLRRTVIVIDHDFGTIEHRIDLYKTNRVDCYRAVADGKPWHNRIGWTRVLTAIRRSFLRISST